MDVYRLLIKWAHHCGFIDEEAAILLIFSSLTYKKGIMVEGTSGAGKSMGLNLLFKIIPEKWVQIAGGDTEAALLRENWDDIKYLYVTELQKFTREPKNIELLKTLGEGKDYTRRIAVGKESVPHTVPGHIVPVMSLAYENKWDDRDPEFHRRYPRISMKLDPEHVSTVKMDNARRSWFRARYNIMTPDERTELERIIRSLIEFDDEKLHLSNPFQEYLAGRFHDFGTATASHVNTYDKFAYGFARLRLISTPAEDRIKQIFTLQNGTVEETAFIVSIQDIALNHHVYGNECQRNIMGVPYLGDRVLELFGVIDDEDDNRYGSLDVSNGLTLRRITSRLKEQKWVVDESYITTLLDDLLKNNHLTTDKKGDYLNWEYRRIRSEVPIVSVDFKECWWAGRENVRAALDEGEFDEWVHSQLDQFGNISWVNPITGDRETLVKAVEVMR